jgi:hypothetical protein
MRRFLPIFLLCFPVLVSAQKIVSETDTYSSTPEAHIFATFVKSFKHGLSLTIEEEIRSAPSHRAHTTVGLGYTPIENLHIYAAYTTMIYGAEGDKVEWSDPNKFIRHRVNVFVTGQWKLGQWNLAWREGVMMDARTDEVDRRAKNNLDFTLRSRIQAVYSIPKTPLGVVGKLEMLSTLNAPVDYINDLVSPSDRYGDYISEWRPELGVQWKINKQNTLSLSYRYNYLYSRNIEVLESGDATITNKYTNKHLILLTYKFGW